VQSGAHVEEIVLALGVGHRASAVLHDDAHAGDAHVPVALAGEMRAVALGVHLSGYRAAVVE
jgi:hypothetical protein